MNKLKIILIGGVAVTVGWFINFILKTFQKFDVLVFVFIGVSLLSIGGLAIYARRQDA